MVMESNNKRAALKEFLNLYRELPVLWDSQHQHYSNKILENEAYKSLLQCYKKIKASATLEDVKRKINFFRSNFQKELKKIRGKRRPATDDIYKHASWVFHELSFLKDLEKPVTSIPTIKETEIPELPKEEVSTSTCLMEPFYLLLP